MDRLSNLRSAALNLRRLEDSEDDGVSYWARCAYRNLLDGLTGAERRAVYEGFRMKPAGSL